MESNALRRPGCLALIVGALCAGGAILYALLPASDPGDVTSGPPDDVTSTPAPAECADATNDFRTASSRYDGGAAAEQASSRIVRVCWAPTGELQVEIDYPSDIEAGAAPMVWLCDAVTRFIEDSGREWKGFTAYSQAEVTLGQPVLSKVEPDGSCVNPRRA